MRRAPVGICIATLSLLKKNMRPKLQIQNCTNPLSLTKPIFMSHDGGNWYPYVKSSIHGFFRQMNINPESAAFVFFTAHTDLSTHQFDQRLTDGQSDAGARNFIFI
ncbi:MAG: hypothetical protein ACI9H8_000630 [Lysobacterales bacterium]|jgi:hypothetical protein